MENNQANTSQAIVEILDILRILISGNHNRLTDFSVLLALLCQKGIITPDEFYDAKEQYLDLEKGGDKT